MSLLSLQCSEAPIFLEIDSVAVVNLMDGTPDRLVFASLAAEIKYPLSLCTTCITLIKHSQNFVADYLANFPRTESRTMVWLGSGLPAAIDLSKADCN